MGIAVGMATNMAPHNLNEVLDASLLLLEKEGKPLTETQKNKALKAKAKELEEAQKSEVIIEEGVEEEPMSTVYSVSIDEIMEIIKGPDFPTGGIIYDSNNIREVYKKGK
jgi:DNA gyrase/topoisomerase IV subunit A